MLNRCGSGFFASPPLFPLRTLSLGEGQRGLLCLDQHSSMRLQQTAPDTQHVWGRFVGSRPLRAGVDVGRDSVTGLGSLSAASRCGSPGGLAALGFSRGDRSFQWRQFEPCGSNSYTPSEASMSSFVQTEGDAPSSILGEGGSSTTDPQTPSDGTTAHLCGYFLPLSYEIASFVI